MITLTSSEICQKYNVSESQIDKATRILNTTTGEIFYQVESQSEAGKVYEVHYHAEYRAFSCSCPAGQVGRPCWHKRAACASAFEFRQAENLAYRKKAEEASQRGYESDKGWQAEERAAAARENRNHRDFASNTPEPKMEVAPSGRSVPMR